MTSPLPLETRLSAQYLLDANVFIASWHDYYPIDLCPGFWECLGRFKQNGRLISIDKVRGEIDSPDELVAWVKQHWQGAFYSTEALEVVTTFLEMQRWVQESNQFKPEAYDEFARAADGWLAAYARVHGSIVVTNEVFDNGIKRRVKLPNLCRQFSVKYCNTVDMLRGLGVAFDLRKP